MRLILSFLSSAGLEKLFLFAAFFLLVFLGIDLSDLWTDRTMLAQHPILFFMPIVCAAALVGIRKLYRRLNKETMFTHKPLQRDPS